MQMQTYRERVKDDIELATWVTRELLKHISPTPGSTFTLLDENQMLPRLVGEFHAYKIMTNEQPIPDSVSQGETNE